MMAKVALKNFDEKIILNFFGICASKFFLYFLNFNFQVLVVKDEHELSVLKSTSG